jgi:hypothetical protein
MERDNDKGLIAQYTKIVKVLAVKAHKGENVTSQVESVVREACEHFSRSRASDPDALLNGFREALKMAAELTHESQPKVRETLAQAASLVIETPASA